MYDKPEGLKLYTIEDDYVSDVRTHIDDRVFANIDPSYIHSRKYLGVLFEINGFSYYAPLSSPKDSDYITIKGHPVIRNSTHSIIRMVETDLNGKRHLLGTIKLSNMLPVPAEKLKIYNIDNEADTGYKNLVLKEIRFINRNKEMLISHAVSLYKEKRDTPTSSKGYLQNTLDFYRFETYITANYHKQSQ